MKSNRHDINRLDAKAAYAKLRIQQNANLFRLNELVSNGEFAISNYNVIGSPVFRYYDKNGVQITNYQSSAVSAAYYGLEWIGDNALVYGDGNGRIGRLDINRDTDLTTNTQLGDFPGAIDEIDLDELGNIYSAHQSGLEGIRRTTLDGSSSVASGGSRINVAVDDEYIYMHSSGTTTRIFKITREALIDTTEKTVELNLTASDTMLVYPEYLIHLRRGPSLGCTLRKIQKSNMEIVKTITAGSPVEIAEGRRMIYDDNGKIYLLQGDEIVELDDDLNVLSVNAIDMGAEPGNEIAIAPSPINQIYVWNGEEVRTFDMNYNLVITMPLNRIFRDRGRFFNAHPGRAEIKFKVLGLQKQF